MQWSKVTAEHFTHSNGLLLSSSALLLFRRMCLYTVVVPVVCVVLDPGEGE
jgi:hypothetical protein